MQGIGNADPANHFALRTTSSKYHLLRSSKVEA